MDRDAAYRSRVNWKLDEDTHFKIRAASFALGITIQGVVTRAVEEWLVRHSETIRKAIRRAEETGIVSFDHVGDRDGAAVSSERSDPRKGHDGNLREAKER